MTYKISVIGLGKAGLPLAAVIASSGISVVGIDIDSRRVDLLNQKKNPLPEEPGLGEIITEHVGEGLVVSDSYAMIADCNVHIVILPLFIDDHHKPDFSILEKGFTSLGKHMKKGDLVVLETTVPPGTTENMIREWLETASGMKLGEFHLAYSPERIMTGYSISRYKEFPKITGGVDSTSGDLVYDVYSQFCSRVEKATDAKTAELVKVCEGVYRDVNIGLANELFKVCEVMGIDYFEVKEKAKHEYCHLLEPGNVGGHCIPVYPWFLIHDFDVPLIETARKLNDDMIAYYVGKAKSLSPSGKVGVIGLSYREGVKEKIYSRSVPLIAALKKEGFEVFGEDPLYDADEIQSEYGVHVIPSFEEMDVLIVFNKLPQYAKELQLLKSKVIDIKNILGKEKSN